jgi:hypothetical protein
LKEEDIFSSVTLRLRYAKIVKPVLYLRWLYSLFSPVEKVTCEGYGRAGEPHAAQAEWAKVRY